MLLKNIHLNNLANRATVYNVGASNKKTEGVIAVSWINTGGSKIFTNLSLATPPTQTEKVKVDLVDNVLPNDTIVNFALIDV